MTTNNIQVSKFDTTRTGKLGRTIRDQYEVTTETLSALPERFQTARWFKVFGDKITAVRKVTIRSYCHFSDTTSDIPAFCPKESYIEIETAHAKACIVEYQFSGAEIGGVVLKNGAKRGKLPCMTLGTWRKHGRKVGHAMMWSYIQHLLHNSKSPAGSNSSVYPAAAYAALAGTTEAAVYQILDTTQVA